MKERAIVIEVGEKEVLVRTIPEEKCSGCCSCGASKGRSFKVSANDAGTLVKGDMLEIEVKASSMMGVYFLIYALPLVVFVLTNICVYSISDSPLMSFTAGVIALCAVYFIVGFCVRKRPSILPVACIRKEGEC